MITQTQTKTKDLPDYFYKKVILNFKKLRIEVRRCKFKSVKDYRNNKKHHWPNYPDYNNEQWKGWCDFLGKEETNKDWPDFFKLKKEVKGKFKTSSEYKKNRKKHWPGSPSKVYKDKGWKNYRNFLGNDWLEFEKLKKEIKGKFKNQTEYRKNRKKNWPTLPHKIYKQWKGWCDFLGKEERYKNWPEFDQLKKEIKGKFKNQTEYYKNRKKHWPSTPRRTYKNKGWKGWDDFLGKN